MIDHRDPMNPSIRTVAWAVLLLALARPASSALEVPPNSMKSKEVPTRQEQVVVPAKRGFFVLMNDAPASLAAPNRAAVKAVLAGLKPKL